MVEEEIDAKHDTVLWKLIFQNRPSLTMRDMMMNLLWRLSPEYVHGQLRDIIIAANVG